MTVLWGLDLQGQSVTSNSGQEKGELSDRVYLPTRFFLLAHCVSGHRQSLRLSFLLVDFHLCYLKSLCSMSYRSFVGADEMSQVVNHLFTCLTRMMT